MRDTELTTGSERRQPRDPVPLGPLAFAAVAVSVAIAIALSRLVSTTGDVSLVWPPLGIAIGLTLVRGWSGLAAVIAGLALWTPFSGAPLVLFPVAAVEIAVGTAVAVLLHGPGQDRRDGALTGVTRLYLAGVVAGAVISALIGAAGFHAAGLFPDMAFGELFFAFWVTEAMGVLLFAPLTRTLARDGVAALWPDRFLALRWLLASAAVFGLTLLVRDDIRDVVALLAGLLIVWPAMLARPAFLHVAVLALMALLLALGLASPAAVDNRFVLELVLRVAGLTVLAQLLNAVSVERTGMLLRERELARRDVLTGLGNERALRERLAALRGSDSCLLALRLEDISGVADLLGGAATEALERTLAGELTERFADDAFRLDRGRYLLVLPQTTGTQASELARTLYDGIDHRVIVGEQDRVALRPTVALAPLGDRDAEELLLAIELAIAVAATHTGVRIETDAGGSDLVLARRDLVRRQEQVKSALQERRFVLYAQPIVPLAGRAGEGLHCEILLRLREPDGTILAPGHFFPAAERAQLTGAIDRYVIEELLAFLAAHPAATARLGKCAINLTGWSVSDPALAPWIAAAVASHRIAPEKLCFEITESQAIASKDTARQLIESLRALGCSVSLDDFGTGLATFDYLKAFPFDYLKIDGGFVKALATSTVDQAVVRAIADVARTMNLKTIAEFVENEALMTQLRAFGVDYAQGYGVGKPLPLADVLGTD